ncbi:MAG TPA: SpoIIE family protein phosphatase, partial [Kamptonema sp.]|nr:SpoIIE family protein phosphatase [Kamptonema sp.]
IPLNNDYKIPLLWSAEEISSESSQSSERPSAFAFNYPKLIPYKFLHDRVQQAAYLLIPEDSKKEVHLRLGNLLLANTNTEELEENIFDIVNHLNRSSDIIDSQIEKDKLAELNLKSGIKAQASAAYQLALSYLQNAIKLLKPNQSGIPQNLQIPLLLQENPWERNYDLTLKLYIEASETASFCGNFEEVEKLTQVILQYARNVLDQVKSYEIRLQAYFQQANKGDEFIKQGLQAVELLGIKLPDQPNSKDLEIRLKEVKALWVNRNIEDLVALPEMADPQKQAAIQILFHMATVASIEFPEIYPFCLLESINLLLENGNYSGSSAIYAAYGMILSGVEQDIDAGYKFGKLAINLLEIFNSKQFEVKVIYIFNTFIGHWKKHIKESLPSLLNTYQRGVETGDITWRFLSAYIYSLHSYWIGKELSILEEEIIKYRNALYDDKYKQELGLRWLELIYQPVFNLLNKVENTHVLDNENYNEKMMLSFYKEVNDIQALCWFHINKIFICYLFHQYQEAIENATAAEAYLSIAMGLYTVPIFYFYSSLSLLATVPNFTESESSEIFIKIAENQEKMALWASHAPMNFQHKFDLVQAEKARVLGQNWEAQELYEKAIQGAKKYEFIQEEALAYERAAEFYLSLGREEIGQLYLRNAHYCYTQWGAKAKVTALETEYPQLRVRITNRTETNRTSTTSTGSNGEVLDLTTVIKASQALAGEIVLDKLLAKLMQFAIENAGAQKGYLILVNNNKLTIEAAREVGKEEVTVLQSQSVETTDLLPQGIINYAMRTQEDLVLGDATHQGLFINEPYIVENQPKSVLCAPIINQGKLIGLLYLENNLTTDAFTADRLELLRILSAQAAISIENALLYQTLEQKVEERTAQLAQANREIVKLNDRLKEDNLRMSAELDITRELQQMILPKESELQQIPGLDIAGFMEPATEVGGDYYDVLNQDGRVKIGIGDVTGHGLESGVVMIMAQTAVRALLANNETDSVRFLNAVNQTIYGNVQRMNADKMLSLALLDYQDGTIRISGQHEEVILIRADGSLELIDTVDLGFPIGLESDVADFINELEIVLNPGDGIVLYTDGITEAENLDGELYGLERLCDVVRQNYNLSATEMQQNIIEDVRRYIGTQEVFDDITLLVLKQK